MATDTQEQDVEKSYQERKRERLAEEKKAAEKEADRRSGDHRKLYADQQGVPAVNIDSTTLPYLPAGSVNIPSFAVVTAGKHKERYGVVEQVASTDKYGFPDEVLFRTRDDETELLVVKYKDLKQAFAGRR